MKQGKDKNPNKPKGVQFKMADEAETGEDPNQTSERDISMLNTTYPGLDQSKDVS